MTHNTTEMVNLLTEAKKELQTLLFEVSKQKSLNPIYQRTFEEKWVVDDVKYYKSEVGECLTGYLLERFDIIFVGSEVEYVDVKKELFVTENGELLVFNHVERYFEEDDNDTCFTISTREYSPDQTITAKEFVSLVDKVKTELNNTLVD